MIGYGCEVPRAPRQIVIDRARYSADEQVQVDLALLALPVNPKGFMTVQLLAQPLEELPQGQNRVETPVVARVEVCLRQPLDTLRACLMNRDFAHRIRSWWGRSPGAQCANAPVKEQSADGRAPGDRNNRPSRRSRNNHQTTRGCWRACERR